MSPDLFETIRVTVDGARELGNLAQSARRQLVERTAELEEARREVGRLRAQLEQQRNEADSVDPVRYLLWSGKHEAWWAPNARGYTTDTWKAGRYTRAEAVDHVIASAQCGVLDQVTSMVAAPENWTGRSPVPVVLAVDPDVQTEQAGRPECPTSKRVDGLLHSWKFDGDDPRIECVFCGEMRDAVSGAVLRDGNHG